MAMLKRVGETFTFQNGKNVEPEDLLCDYCGFKDCPIRKRVKALVDNPQNAVIVVKACESFVPILNFIDGNGLTDRFNTIRLGHAWADRLARGVTVSLAVQGTVVGAAEVVKVHRGELADMLLRYGNNNHLARHAASEGREVDMMKVMTRCYGTNRAKPDSRATVIDLRRL